LNSDSRWLWGPEFLRQDEKCWPPEIDHSSSENAGLDISEFRMNNSVLTISNSDDNFIDYSRFSTWKRLISVASLVLKAVDILKNQKDSDLNRFCRAETLCFKQSQKNSFLDEIRLLSNFKEINKKSRLLNLDPKLDNQGVLRVGGRLSKLSVENFSSNPIILDAKNRATVLLIEHFHDKFFHGNHQTVLNEIRQHFWIVGLRRALRKIVNQCIICKFLRGQPANPKMGNLPIARLGFRLSPFANSGVDFFGPLYVKVGRKKEKRWCALFTCLTIRAIHLEILPSISANSVIMAIQRFVARRGIPEKFFSDSGVQVLKVLAGNFCQQLGA
jgi:hypothetical protein